MTMEGMDLIPLESNLHKYDPVIISQIINMIETDSFWHCKTFESVMSDLQNLWTEGICELENVPMHCTNNGGKDAEMDEMEFINLCSILSLSTYVVLVRIRTRRMTREKKAQSKKVRTKRNPTQRIEWKTN